MLIGYRHKGVPPILLQRWCRVPSPLFPKPFPHGGKAYPFWGKGFPLRGKAFWAPPVPRALILVEKGA